MATITIRNLDESTKKKLRVRAAKNNRSMADEARNILRAALGDDLKSEENLAESIHQRFKALGGLELELPKRVSISKPPQSRR